MGRLVDLTGQRFGGWTVLGRSDKTYGERGATLWDCRCDCGTERAISSWKLRNGLSNSCGCLGRPSQVKSVTKHNGSNTRLYRIWVAMRSRAYYRKGREHKNYGARGIVVCDEWQTDFVAFRDWALSNGYRDDLTLDRIDNNGNYEPGNCRWTTMSVQGNNKRTCVYVTYNDETHTITEWARMLGMHPETLRGRIVKRKWSIERAFTQPIQRR